MWNFTARATSFCGFFSIFHEKSSKRLIVSYTIWSRFCKTLARHIKNLGNFLRQGGRIMVGHIWRRCDAEMKKLLEK